MITSVFHTIGIIGHSCYPKAIHIYSILYHWLCKQDISVIVEQYTARLLNIPDLIIGNLNDIGNYADLAVIIGGDGNMLRAATILSQHNIKIIGINLGTVGFLADLNPNSALTELTEILSGNFIDEQRFLLDVNTKDCNQFTKLGTAINEIILHTHTIKNTIEFELYIDNNFICLTRSDGLIIATPTGSTAYSLSAGGPILTPSVDAIVLVPICPHTLSSRPIIIHSNSIISLKFSQVKSKFQIGCDNQTPISICKEKEIFVKRSNYSINFIHPNHYNYFKNLNIKLGWEKTF